MPIDPTIKALASAIGEAETGASSPKAYTIKGKSGEYGRYQMMPDTYKNYAQKYLGDAAAPPSIENQNKIVYSFIQDKKSKGFNPAQIASMWNAGEGRPNAYKEGWKGVNDQGVEFNTPLYAERVSHYYQRNKEQNLAQGFVPDAPMQTQTQDHTLLGDLGNVASEAGGRFSNALTQSLSGQINPLSGLIQGVGAVAGGIGGGINTLLEHTPVVGSAYKGLEGLIGEGVGALANTETGKGLITNYQSFAQNHPELAGDISSGIDIASVIPIFKGLTAIKGAGTSAVETAIKGSATKSAEQEIVANLPSKVATGLVTAQKRGLNPVQELVTNKEYLPDVVRNGEKFVYDSAKAETALNAALDSEEAALQALLDKGIKKNIGVVLPEVRAQVLKDVAKEYTLSGNHDAALKAVGDYFDSIMNSSGGRTVVSLNELNAIKRDVRKAVNFDNLGAQRSAVRYQIGQSLMRQVEETAKKAGAEGVDEINKTMAQKLEALKLLEAINGKTIKVGTGAGREIARDIAGGAGEMAGNAIGIPLAGTFAGRGLAGLVGRRLPKTAIGKLKQSRPLKTTIKRGTKQLGVGLAGQAAAQQLQTQ